MQKCSLRKMHDWTEVLDPKQIKDLKRYDVSKFCGKFWQRLYSFSMDNDENHEIVCIDHSNGAIAYKRLNSATIFTVSDRVKDCIGNPMEVTVLPGKFAKESFLCIPQEHKKWDAWCQYSINSSCEY